MYVYRSLELYSQVEDQSEGLTGEQQSQFVEGKWKNPIEPSFYSSVHNQLLLFVSVIILAVNNYHINKLYSSKFLWCKVFMNLAKSSLN